MKVSRSLGLILTVGGVVVGVLVGHALFSPNSGDGKTGVASRADVKDATRWTCSMHPQIKRDQPGKCPICDMELIPMKDAGEEGDDDAGAVLRMSPRARKLAEIATSPVERKYVDVDIRLTGKIEHDQTLTDDVSAHFPGRIEKLYVEYVGMPIKRGDHMAEIFSPELSVLQDEFLLSLKELEAAEQSNSAQRLRDARKTLRSVKSKMNVWGLVPKQIDEIAKRGTVSERVTLYSPASGVVVAKNVKEGEYFKTGDVLFSVADLSHLWVMLEAYEIDVPWIHYGQDVVFEVAAWPGREFNGKIVYIAPEMERRSRIVPVRANVANPDGELRPGMFVRAVVKATVGEDGVVVGETFAGRWICPMHPEVVEDSPGQCGICGMDLVEAETLPSLKQVKTRKDVGPALVIPASAPLVTGERAVVYVDLGEGKYEGRTIKLGPRAGDDYVVIDGLTAGERVVTNGSFKIDGDLQIKAKPSMMGARKPPFHSTAEKANASQETVKTDSSSAVSNERVKTRVRTLVSDYFAIQDALASDDAAAAGEATNAMLETVRKDMRDDGLDAGAAERFQADLKNLETTLERLSETSSIESARERFEKLSTLIEGLVRRYGVDGEGAIFKARCPMAFDNAGADWLQSDENIRNPYFGSSMYRCGEIKERLHPPGKPRASNDDSKE